MLNQSELQHQLLRGGVKPRYVRRTLEELQYHAEDLRQQGLDLGFDSREATTRAQHMLGDNDTIARAVLSRNELKTLSFRFPKMVYLLSPLLCFLLVFIGSITAITIIAVMVVPGDGQSMTSVPSWLLLSADVLLIVNSHLLAPLLVAVFCIAARNRMMDMTWPVIGILLLAFVSAGQSVTTAWPASPDDVGSISVSWGYRFIGIPVSWEQTVAGTLQFLMMMLLAVGVYFYWPMRGLRCEHEAPDRTVFGFPSRLSGKRAQKKR